MKDRGEFRGVLIKEGVVPSGHGGAGTGRSGSRSGEPTEAARERRLRLDPDQLAREQRIDEATVDVEVAWEARGEAEEAVTDAEVAVAAAVERLLAERLAVKDVVKLTGLDQATVRRLRQLESDSSDEDGATAEGDGGMSDPIGLGFSAGGLDR